MGDGLFWGGKYSLSVWVLERGVASMGEGKQGVFGGGGGLKQNVGCKTSTCF